MNNKKKINEWKSKIYRGENISLKPVDEDDLRFIIDMRNQEKSKYFLNQELDSTIDSQKRWYDNYITKEDDIYWIYCDISTGRRLGTIRLYNIEEKECEIGSSTADQSAENSFFYFMEAHSLAIRFAKDVIGISEIHVETRTDNKFVDVMLKRIGFEFKNIIDIRGVDYNYYEMYIGGLDDE